MRVIKWVRILRLVAPARNRWLVTGQLDWRN